MTNQVVSSSSFSSTPSWKYDIFLSFRGEDTCTSFTDHLYKGLVDKGIHTFIDRQLPRGEEISPALFKAIEESRISLVIFSKSYASSRWCLDELVKILHCRESKKQIVLPVFYKVDPSHVRNQKSSFGDAFTDHESKFKDKKEKVLMWRRALREVANLSGYPFLKGDSEATFISNVVEDILVKVRGDTCLNVAKHPVGIQSCVQEVKELLGVGGNDRCVVGIWGISGIGKTTIAKAVYNAIAHKFEGRCFLADVRETSTSSQGVIQLQNTLLSKVLCGTELKVVDVHEGISLIKKLLRGKKILLILDDVDRLEQLNNLVEVDWFGEGSRVIITSKNRGLLESYGVELIYEVQKLMDDKALELLSLNAFGINEPPDDYLILAHRAIAYAQGLPLALNLIGSHLRKKSIDRWKAILDSYDSYVGEPYTDIQRILRKSYDAWDYVVQQVFLDIACFFKGEHKDYVLQILKSSKLNVPQDCIEVLVENAIITIEYNRILMHDLLEKMGKRIVYEESPTEPGKRSRLWFHEDVYHVLTENQGTKKIRGIVVELPEPDVITLNAESFLRMVNLEIFINRNARFFGRVDYLPNDLRWIELGGQSNFQQRHRLVFNLPSNYHPRHLAGFDVPYSGIRPLKEFKNLAKLTNMNLSGCEFLEKIPDLSGSPNLKHLVLSDCKSLVEVDDSVGFLDKLVELNLYGCSKLTRFVTRLGSRFLKTLSLRSCASLESFPEIEERKMESLTDLDIGESGIRELPSSIAYLTGLAYLFADKCENLIGTSLHHLSGLQSLSEISLRQCPKLVTYGKNKRTFDEVSSSSTESQLPSTDLETSQDNCSTWLDLSRNNFVSLPDCISKFVNLETLYLTGCKRLREIPQLLPPNLKFLYLNDCTSLEKTPKLPPTLNYLDLTNCYKLSGDEVTKLENNLLNEESLWCPGLEVIYPGNEVPNWFSYTSNHPTTIEHLPEDDEIEEFVGGSEFCFEIPLNLQGETLLGLAVSVVLDAPGTNLYNSYILINRSPWLGPHFSRYKHIEATHVWLKVLDLDENAQRRDICQVIFRFSVSARIKRCGVHLLRATKTNGLPNEYYWEETSYSEGSDIFYDAYDHQEQ